MEIYSYEKMKYLASQHEDKISALLSDMIKFNKRMEASEKLGTERTARMRARNYELLKRMEALEGRVYKCSPVGFPCGDMDCDDCSHSPKHDDDCAWHSSFDPMDVEHTGTIKHEDRQQSRGPCAGMDCSVCKHHEDCTGHTFEHTFERVQQPETCADREVVVFKHVVRIHSDGADVSYISALGYTSRIEYARKFRTMPEATAYAVEQGLGDVSFRFVDAAIEAGHVIDVGDLITRGGSGVDRWVVLRNVSQGGDRLDVLDVLCVIGDPVSVWDAGDINIETRCRFTLVARAGEWGS